MRRSVARFLAICMFIVAPGLVMVPQAAAAPVLEELVSFTDVPESSLFHKEISWLAAEGISTGWDGGGGKREYRPLNSIARDAMAAFLYRHAGSPPFTPPGTSPFVDVPAGAAFYKEITWLASKSISTGWDIGGGKREYRPLNAIARDAMAAFLYRYAQPAQFTAPAQSPFTDVAGGGAFYNEITWLADSGISTGWDIGGGKREYRPLNGIARDAMAAFLYRYASDKVPADPTSPTAGTVTIAPEVEVLTSTQLDAAQLSVNTVTLPSDKARDIHPNDVIVSGVTQGTPEGLLARVVQVIRDPSGSTVVKTQPATLTEAVVSTSGLVDVTGVPVWSTFAAEPDVTETQAAQAAGPGLAPQAAAQTDVFSRSMSWKKTLRGETGSSALGGDGTLTVDSSVTAAAKARMTLETGFLQLKETSVVLTPSVEAAHSLTVEGHLAGKVSAKLGELNSGFTFMIGPVPVVVTTQLKISATVTVNGDAEISFVSSQTVSSDHGFRYRDGSFSLINTKPTTEGIENTIKASASLTTRASLDFDATVKFYGIAGITFGVGPYATAAISVSLTSGNTTWTCPAELGVAARLGVTAGIDILGFKLGDWTKTTTTTWPLYTTNPCQGTPVQAPGGSNPGLRVTTPAQLPNATVGQNYQAALTGAGGTTPYRWSISSGSLPAGLTLAPATGHISGTPTQTGSSSFTVQVQDNVWASASKTLTLYVGNGNYGEPLTNVKGIAGGYGNALALKKDGTVFGWGGNNSGQVGDGTTTPRLFPVQVPSLSRVTSIAADSSNGYALKDDGTVWAWGANNFGQIGDGTTQTRLTPVQVPGLSGIRQISTGSGTALGLAADGTVWAWGNNSSGQLGDGTTTNRPKPVKLPLTNVRMIAVGDYLSTYALKNDGTVWSWGLNNAGQLGNGTTGPPASSPQLVSGLNGIMAIDAGSLTAYALKDNGTVWAWGENSAGQLGDGSTTARTAPVQAIGLSGVQTIEAGQYGNVFVKRTDGTIWGWGDNSYGQMFDPFTSPGPNYPAAGAPRLAPAEIPALWEAIDVYAGMYGSSYALMPDGTVWAWGHNFFGQLGDGTRTTRLNLIPVGVAAQS